MSLWRLIARSLSFYWRTNLAVLLSATVTTAVLAGALVVGDSVRHSLKMMAAARLGTTQLALVPQNRFFRAELADELAVELDTIVAPVLQLRGLIANTDGTKRANKIQVLGVDERFFKVGGGGNPFGQGRSEGMVPNEPLAARLSVEVGDEVVLRVEKPGLMPRDVPLVPDSDLSMAFRLAVTAIAGQGEFGLFNLQANHVAPLNVFVPMRWLQEKLGLTGQANMLLVAENQKDSITVERANEAISKHWQLADAGLELRELKRAGTLEISSRRIFIEESLRSPAMRAVDGAVGVLTYFINEFRLGDRTTPYSMVTAMERSAGAGGLIPKDMRDDEILINRWLAEDLGAKVGDVIELAYFVVGPMNKLQEAKSSLRVRGILPMEGPGVDPELMPDFPGLADADNCRDWEPGIPIDLDKIRKRDEDYWDKYRGTPKAFVTLEAGQAMWANRYGKLTAVRYLSSRIPERVPAPTLLGAVSPAITAALLNAVDPASTGLYFQSVRERGLKAGDEATDFGQLFLGLSMFITAAALVLMGLVFVFGVENRSAQVGMLLAVGFSPKLVKRLLFIEGGILAVLGAVAGTVAGLLYTKAMIYGLSTVWQAAVAGSMIHFYAKTSTLCKGAIGAVVVSLIAVWLTLRKQVTRPARELLAGNLERQYFAAKLVSKGRIGLAVAAMAAVAAVVVLAVVGGGDSASVSGAFFGAGALLLVAGLALCQALLRIMQGRWNRPMVSLAGLGLRNSTRRSGRSLAVVALLACGIFLVIAVGANKRDPLAQAHRRDSGTGGFALFGESAMGILQDLNSDSGRKSLGLDDGDLRGVRIVRLRVHDGDDASCLNLNRAQRPRLLGVRSEQLQERGAFGFAKTVKGVRDKRGWELLNADLGADVVPAIGDYATIVWGLRRSVPDELERTDEDGRTFRLRLVGMLKSLITWALRKSVPDELEYTDENGRTFRLRLVGMLKNSILQGSLIISEDEFVKRFPSEDGYRVFLVDAPAERAEAIAARLSGSLRDFGLALTPARQRLAAFGEVENTYLSIFRVLGGLGLVLGSLGLGLVVLRNILERRGELAMLRAVGFDKGALKRMVFCEHWGLMVCGLACGVVAALVAVVPALRTPGAQVPYFSLALTIIGIAIGGAVWIRLATGFALSGKLLEALRNE